MIKKRTAVCFAAMLLAANYNLVSAQQAPSAADVFPDSTVAYLEVANPTGIIDNIQDHPVVKLIQDHEQFKKLIASPQFVAAFLGKALLENQIDDTLLNALRDNLAGGIYIAFDGKTRGVALLSKSNSPTKLKRFAGSVLNMIAAQATNEAREIPFKKETYRGVNVARFDKFVIARYETWLLISTNPKLAQQVIDNFHDSSSTSLARQDWFVSASKKRAPTDLWAAVNLEVVRAASKSNPLLLGKTNNPGVELVFGGILDALKNAPFAIAEVTLERDLKVSLSMPFDKAWVNESREFFFGDNLSGRAPGLLQPENTIANLTSYRDVGGWWLSKEDLFDESVIAQLARADSELSNIFPGMDFGADVLGALEPGVQIVIVENEFDEHHVPDVRLPAFALVGKLKDAEQIQRKLKIAFQSVIGFANINLGMQGQPQLDLETEKIGETKVSSASYVYDKDVEEGLLLFNFAPTVAFHGDHIIIASSRPLALELAKMTDVAAQPSESNTLARVDGERLHRILKDNRESLIAQNMLEKGHDRKSAANEIDTLLAILEFLKKSELDFRVEADEMRLNLTVTTLD